MNAFLSNRAFFAAVPVVAMLTSVSLGGGLPELRATCDNRAGDTFADVADSSDPTQAGYNIDPSENYRDFNNISFPVNQNVGNNLSSANLTINSLFLGNNPGNRTAGFTSACSGTASATRSNTNVQARSQNRINVCFMLSNASAGNPSVWRVVAGLTSTPGATASVNIQGAGGVITSFNQNAPQNINRLFRFTQNGEYSITAQFDTGMISLSAGGAPVTRSASTTASIVCAADFNASGTVTTQDIFDYLDAWFLLNTSADMNFSNSVSVDDIFAYIAAWFTGCN